MKLLLCYKNFAKPGVSHIGLGVSALNTAKVLKSHGVDVIVRAVQSVSDINSVIESTNLTHVVISAPWIMVPDMATLIGSNESVEFAVNCHSNVGFLQADTRGVDLIRSYIDLEQGGLNFSVSANSKRGTRWLRSAYACPCAYLPNLYALDYSHSSTQPLWNGGVLNIGAFGATRVLKNLMSAAGAALIIKNALKAQVNFYISSGRVDGGATTVASVKAMVARVPGFTLIENGWLPWPTFRDSVRHMHVLLQPSYTESFNMVTADGIAEGVPSVTSDSIDWVPPYWQASADNAGEIARIGMDLIRNPYASRDGLVHLEQHNKDGFDAWTEWLGLHLPYNSLLTDPWLI